MTDLDGNTIILNDDGTFDIFRANDSKKFVVISALDVSQGPWYFKL